MEIKDYPTASNKLQWINMAYQIFILDQQFLLELKLTLDDLNEVIPMLEAKEIKTERGGNNSLNALYKNENGNTKKLHLTYDKIEELYQDITNSLDENLQERMN